MLPGFRVFMCCWPGFCTCLVTQSVFLQSHLHSPCTHPCPHRHCPHAHVAVCSLFLSVLLQCYSCWKLLLPADINLIFGSLVYPTLHLCTDSAICQAFNQVLYLSVHRLVSASNHTLFPFAGFITFSVIHAMTCVLI